MKHELPVPRDSFEAYLREISKFPVLSREEEQELARRYRDEGDLEAAKKLVCSNLRFVVKVAYEFRNYDIRLIDMIQEGNIGLMKAVRKFNPDRGYKLISYAVWWIKAYMQSHIINSWSMVRVGPAALQRRLFFGTRAGAQEVSGEEGGDENETFLVAAKLSGEDPAATAMRLAARDFSLDAQMSEDSRLSYLDLVPSAEPSQEQNLVQKEESQAFSDAVDAVVRHMSDKERYIFEHRLVCDEPETLQDIGDRFGISRERVRQIEDSVKKKIRRAVLAERGTLDSEL